MVTMRALMYSLSVSVMLAYRSSVVATIAEVTNITRKVASTSSETASLNATFFFECFEPWPPCGDDSACSECYDDIETSEIDECDQDTTSVSLDEMSCDTWSEVMCCAEHVFDGGCPADETYINGYKCILEAYGCSTESSQCDENAAAAATVGGALLRGFLCFLVLVFAFTVGTGI